MVSMAGGPREGHDGVHDTTAGHGGREDDARRVARLRGGDATAFDELYRTHVHAVGAAVRDRVREPEAHADLVQEAFVRALERLDTLRDPAAFRPWLLSIARRVAVDGLRTRQRSSPVAVDSIDLTDDAGEDPQQVAELAELAERVRSGFALLSRRDATALELATRFGLSTEELAAALGLSTGAAKVALHRARRRLRQALRLQTLAYRCAGTCDELRRLYASGALAAAATHVDGCRDCGDVEVEGFAAPVVGM